MTRNAYTDDLPTRQGMRTPHKGRHGGARFTNRTTPARFHHDEGTAR